MKNFIFDRNKSKLLRLLGVIILIPILTYLFLLGASSVYVSGDLASDFFSDVSLNPIWSVINKINSPWLPKPSYTHIQQVSMVHFARNALFIFCTGGLLGVFPICSFIAGLLFLPFGLFTANWEIFGSGLITTFILTPLSIIAILLGLAIAWLVLLIQPCTPAYMILWLIVGTPLAALGTIGGATPAVTVIVIVK